MTVTANDRGSVRTDTRGDMPRGDREVLAKVTELAERIREHALEERKLVDERNAAIRQAIDLYRCSQRQVARASGLSIGRIHGILAND